MIKPTFYSNMTIIHKKHCYRKNKKPDDHTPRCMDRSCNKRCDALAALHWRHNGNDSVSNHQLHDCLLKRLFWRRSKKIPKLRVTSLCARNSLETGEFPAQMASNAENISIWWRHHGENIPDRKCSLPESSPFSPKQWLSLESVNEN